MFSALNSDDENDHQRGNAGKKKSRRRNRRRGKKKPAPAPGAAPAATNGSAVTSQVSAPAPAPAARKAAPAPAPASASSSKAAANELHANLEKVANMKNVEEVLDAFIKFLPLAPENLQAFFQSKALKLLVSNLLRSRPPIHLDSKLQYLMTLCLGEGGPHGAANLISHKLRQVIEALNEWQGGTPPPVEEMASWLALTISRQKPLLRSETTVENELESLNKQSVRARAARSQAQNSLKAESGSIRSRFRFRDSAHGLVNCLQRKAQVITASNSNCAGSACASLAASSFYKALVAQDTSYDPQKEREMKSLEAQMKKIHSARMGRIEPVEEKVRALQANVNELQQRKRELLQELNQVNDLLAKRNKELTYQDEQKALIDREFDGQLTALNRQHHGVASVVREAVKRQQLVKEFEELSSDLDGIASATDRAISKRHANETQTARQSFLDSIHAYLLAEKSCVDFLTKRTEANVTGLGGLNKELKGLEASGIAKTMPAMTADLKKRIKALEQSLTEDRACTQKLLGDANAVFDAVKAQSKANDLSSTSCSTMYALLELFRALDIGNDWSPPPLSGSAKPAAGAEPWLQKMLKSEPPKPAASAAPAPVARKPRARPQPRQQRPARRQQAPPPKKTGWGSTNVKLSWAKKGPAKKAAPAKSLLEVMADQAKNDGGAAEAAAAEGEQ